VSSPLETTIVCPTLIAHSALSPFYSGKVTVRVVPVPPTSTSS